MFIEIVGLQPLVNIPEMPENIKSVIDLRGNIAVMDDRLRFAMSELEYNYRTCITVIEIEKTSIGLIIDSVSDVLTINDDQIFEKPKMSSKSACGYIKNIGRFDNHVIMLIECNELISTEEYSKYGTDNKK